MNKKLKKVVAIAGLIFAGLFPVCFILAMVLPDVQNGLFGALAFFTGFFAVGFWLVIWMDNRLKKPYEADGPQPQPENTDGEAPAEGEEK